MLRGNVPSGKLKMRMSLPWPKMTRVWQWLKLSMVEPVRREGFVWLRSADTLVPVTTMRV